MWLFFLNTRALAHQGTDMPLLPTANSRGVQHVKELVVPKRVNENRMVVVYANYTGQNGKIYLGGGSVIAGPDGKALTSAGVMPATLIADLPDPGDYPAHRFSSQSIELRLAHYGQIDEDRRRKTS